MVFFQNLPVTCTAIRSCSTYRVTALFSGSKPGFWLSCKVWGSGCCFAPWLAAPCAVIPPFSKETQQGSVWNPPVTPPSSGTAGQPVSVTGQTVVCRPGGFKAQSVWTWGTKLELLPFPLTCWHAGLSAVCGTRSSRKGGGCQVLMKAQNYRVKNQEKNRHKDSPEFSIAGWEHLLAAGWLQSRHPAARQHQAEPCRHPLLFGSPPGWP